MICKLFATIHEKKYIWKYNLAYENTFLEAAKKYKQKKSNYIHCLFVLKKERVRRYLLQGHSNRMIHIVEDSVD